MERSRLASAIATLGGLGDRLPAPGTTAGSLPAVVLWWCVAALLPTPAQRLLVTIAGCALATAIGVWAAGEEARRRGSGDPQPVVIDELAGQWLTMAVALLLVEPVGAAGLGTLAAAGLVLFRFFDVAKPWPVRRLERIPGGLGIVADDLAAGALAGLGAALAWRYLG